MKPVLYAFICLVLIGCKPAYYKADTTPDEERQDKLECKLEAAKVTGYDWIDAASNKREVEQLCLEVKGYTREKKNKAATKSPLGVILLIETC